ncbi:AAEL002466-PA [Aedes aegypti]|uniref:AAEL002466-PA n=1 Tax=Aedes aegypti TaxID=7159 RepID=Q17I31_AEDAE|nr:AAEL002466-PA [Aedes aegypti]
MRDLFIILVVVTCVHVGQDLALASPLLIKCPSVISSNHPVYLPHVNKHMYYLCSEVGLLELFCGEGCTFNTQQKSCECPKQVQSNRYIHTTTFPEETGKCPRPTDSSKPIYLSHRNCAKYYHCTPNGAVEMNCTDGFYWSVEANRCDRPWHARCAGSGTSGSKSSLASTIGAIRIDGATTLRDTTVVTSHDRYSTEEPTEFDGGYTTDYPDIQ